MTERHTLQDFSPEDRGQICQMMQSRPFRLLLTHVLVPKLEQLSIQLDNHTLPHDTTQFLRGQKYNARQFLDYCSTIAGLPSLFTPRQATGVDIDRILKVLEEQAPSPSATSPSAMDNYTPSYGSGRTSFPA